ncbi:hypothetical protein CRG98_020370 [Punica granatum]|uniref:Uncharacterized protein n=1 Tax=Punica granatum TaxID=22663 RepID=A0A2I0JSB1_PUNGR|nr:hypothetical protein CRG98_020370 [Punica granatum]
MSTPASEWESLYHRNGDGQGVVLKCGSERQEASSELGDVNGIVQWCTYRLVIKRSQIRYLVRLLVPLYDFYVNILGPWTSLEFEIHKVAMARGGANEEAGGAIAPPEL